MPTPPLSRELREIGEGRLKQEIEACNGDLTPLTTYIFKSIGDGSLSPDFFNTYYTCAQDFSILTAGLRQTESFFVRSKAIRKVYHIVHFHDAFTKLWDALGGAHGLASLMREMSVFHVRSLCHVLGTAITNPRQIPERQQALSELLNLLCPLDPSDSESGSKLRDPRPLQPAYMRLVRGCTPELTRRWLESNKAKWDEKDIQWFRTVHGIIWRDQDLKDLLLLPESEVVRLHRLEWYMERDRKFTAHVLKTIVECPSPGLKVDKRDMIDQLILPMARYIHRPGPSHEFRYEVWASIDAALARWPELPNDLADFGSTSLAWCAVKCWTDADFTGDVARKARIWTVVGSILERLLKVTGKLLDGSGIRNFLRAAQFEDRFDLLKAIFRHRKEYGFDLAYPCSAENLAIVAKLGAYIPCELFTMIPARDGIEFLDLLAEAQAPNVCITRGMGLLSTSADPDTPYLIDLLTLRCYILQRVSDGFAQKRLSLLGEVEEDVKRRMATCARSRDAAVRRFWAVSALNLCIASGSLDMYIGTLEWARRYKRDSLVNRDIQNQYLNPTDHALNLMSGTHINTPLHAVKDCIEKGNKIALSIFEIMVDSREPTAPPPSSLWTCTFMASKLAKTRVRQIEQFQARHSLSDDEVFEMVWQPTLSLLVEAERLAVESVQGELELSRISGVLELVIESNEKLIRKDHVWRFLNELCEARDKLWQRERIRRRPAVMTLGEPWCKGLPIQFLLPDFLTDATRHGHRYNEGRQGSEVSKLPYLLAKAKAVVFTDQKHLVRSPPDDEETLWAVQGFVDDFAMAVELLVHGQGGDKEKTSTQIWQHCVEHLTGGRLTDSEAVQFWRRWVFGPSFTHLPSKHVVVTPQDREVEVGFPEWSPEDGPLAWDPTPVVQAASTLDDSSVKHDPPLEEDVEKALRAMSIWHMLGVSKLYHDPKDALSLRATFRNSSKGPYNVPTTIFQVPRQLVTAPPETEISKIAKEMLVFNSHHGAESGFLMQPFPSARDARFPAAYLADEFLESKHNKPICNPHQLDHQIQHVPVELLLQLASSVFKKMASGEKVTSHTTWAYMSLIKLLGRSDRPSAACDLYRDVILTRPQDSSWHRDILHVGFLNRLSPTEAKNFLLDMARSIIDRLQAQAKHKLEEGKPMATAPFVKVTVVKLLAQVMRGSQFVDEETACEVLGAILKNARHIDIRAAAVSVLVDYFSQAPEGTGATTIVKTLETEAVPVAACLSERYPMTEERWAEAEKAGELPEIDPFNDTNRPILAALAAATNTQLSRPEWKGKWQETLLAKTIEKSTKTNSRWMTLFLKVNSFSLAEGELLPEFPINPAHLNNYLVEANDEISLDTFNRIKQLSLDFLCNAPKSITAAVQNSKILSKSNAGKHWLYTWSSAGTGKVPGNVISGLGRILSNAPFPSTPSSTGNMTTIKDIQDFLLSLADIFINTANRSGFDALISSLIGNSNYFTYRCSATWKANSLPLINNIISKVDALRESDAWRKDKDRKPAALPDTFCRRLDVVWALYKNDDSGTIPQFAGEIRKLLAFVLRTPYYHPNWAILRQHVLREAQSAARLRLAWELADDLGFITGDHEPNLEEYLRVELALALIWTDYQDVKGPVDGETKRVMKSMMRLLKAWEGSEDEVVREGARRALREGWVEFEEDAVVPA
ncbi:hypothetical protein QBC44DRAFT_394184 [Cladorrhinum sp. PSN332]|nr:hypothetical protein QBC44DRAFT_394184 [Cladorrhinum sp. PSN332]